MMQLILLERVGRLGTVGDVVTVRPGYGRNFLIPQGKALRATKANIAEFEAKRAEFEAENLRKRGTAEEKAAKIGNLHLIVCRQASESGQLYGSVSGRDVADLVTAQHFALDKSQVRIDTPIKTTGVHKIQIALHPEVQVDALLSVAPTEEEAQRLIHQHLNPESKKKSSKKDYESSAEENPDYEVTAAENIEGTIENAIHKADAHDA